MIDVLVKDINQLNVTMQVMQTNIANYIASNDLKLTTISDSLQYVVKTPMTIFVPSSDEIDHHRSEFSKIQRNRLNFELRRN